MAGRASVSKRDEVRFGKLRLSRRYPGWLARRDPVLRKAVDRARDYLGDRVIESPQQSARGRHTVGLRGRQGRGPRVIAGTGHGLQDLYVPPDVFADGIGVGEAAGSGRIVELTHAAIQFRDP